MNILSTTSRVVTAQERREDAVLDVVDFIRRDGMALYDLLSVLGDEEGADALAELVGLCAAPLPARSAVMAEMAEVALSLNMLSFREIDALATSGRATFDVYNAVRWSGARVADLCARLAAT
ncbi:hypothetical protein [Salipiger sp. PrR002]|uniref:hypothetical protein n=1 Tax=Salipiger sp. PrR002 TaxID=2706489 RepID=UPI0013B87BC0|nr:hypothetical protein [Salipiger sp. PrR002]NDW01149.1 hypothetical protein [Salipiger sp. PrR002]NDW58813.1 hypothetical protein [Salipiger sp. PrR004]